MNYWNTGEGNGNPLQYFCLENPMDREAWQATVHGVARVRHNLVTKERERDWNTAWMSLQGIQFSSVQSLSRVRLFVTPWTIARQASLSITNSQSLPKPMSIELVMPSNHLIFCRLLLLLSSIFPSIRVFSNESALHIRWPKYWSIEWKKKCNPKRSHTTRFHLYNIHEMTKIIEMENRLMVPMG